MFHCDKLFLYLGYDHKVSRFVHFNFIRFLSFYNKHGGNLKKFYFAGDTGYFFGFKLIGEVFGPFDVVCLPIGVYEPVEMMRPVHMDPEEVVEAYIDLKGKIFCVMNWDTFDLANEKCDDSPKGLFDHVKKLNLNIYDFRVFRHGGTIKW